MTLVRNAIACLVVAGFLPGCSGGGASGDPSGAGARSLVRVTVGQPVNRAPSAAADAVTTVMDSVVTINVLANDSDPDNNALRIVAVGSPIRGAVVIDDAATSDPSDDVVVYTTPAGYSGMDSFAYTVSDGVAVVDATVTVHIGHASAAGQICGRVTKGPVDGAWVRLYTVDGLGLPGTLTAQTLTDDNGGWCVPGGAHAEPLLVVSAGGSFFDEADTNPEAGARRKIAFGNNQLLESVLPAGADFAATTVFSGAVLHRARLSAPMPNWLTT